jgi:hypothetical protein
MEGSIFAVGSLQVGDDIKIIETTRSKIQMAQNQIADILKALEPSIGLNISTVYVDVSRWTNGCMENVRVRILTEA